MQYPTEASLARTVDSLYLAVAEESQWPEALTRVSEAFESPRVAIMRATPRMDGIFEMRQLNHDPEAQRQYETYYWAFDPGHRLTRNAPVGQWLDQPELFDPRTTREPEYMDFAIRHGIRYVAGGNVHADAAAVTMLGFQRPMDHKPFDATAADVFGRIGHHIGRAAALASELRRAEITKSLSLTALDSLEWPVFAIDGGGKLLLANKQGEAMLARRDPVLLRAGRLSSLDPEFDLRLKAGLQLAGRLRADAFTRCFQGERWLVRTVPLAGFSGAALVYVSSADAPVVPAEVLKRMFNFSPAEAEIAYMVAEGWSAKEIAHSRGVSVNTIRSQIKQVFAKAHVRRQAELARMLSNVPRVR